MNNVDIKKFLADICNGPSAVVKTPASVVDLCDDSRSHPAPVASIFVTKASDVICVDICS
jgi:hypothetical protein